MKKVIAVALTATLLGVCSAVLAAPPAGDVALKNIKSGAETKVDRMLFEAWGCYLDTQIVGVGAGYRELVGEVSDFFKEKAYVESSNKMLLTYGFTAEGSAAEVMNLFAAKCLSDAHSQITSN